MSEDLQERLRAAREKRAALAKERAEREAERATLAEVEAEERRAADEEAIAKAEKEHGEVNKRIRCFRTDMGVVIVRRPNVANFNAFMDKGDHSYPAMYELAVPCVVHPDGARFEAMLAEQPFILTRAADAVAWLAGVRKEELEGKS
jgi:hypothetical protein